MKSKKTHAKTLPAPAAEYPRAAVLCRGQLARSSLTEKMLKVSVHKKLNKNLQGGALLTMKADKYWAAGLGS